jgi:aminopeptidase
MTWSKTPSLDEKILRNLFFHAGGLQKGDRFILECLDIPQDSVVDIVEQALALDIFPIVSLKNNEVISAIARKAGSEYYKVLAEIEIGMFQMANTIIGLRPLNNNTSLSGVSGDQRKIVLDNFIRPVHFQYRNKNMNWVYYRLAQADCPVYDDYIASSQMDYSTLYEEMQPLAHALSGGREVRITAGSETDVTFRIHTDKIGLFRSSGMHNLPDGEIFTAPVRDSVQGRIRFNVPTSYYGHHFNDIDLTFLEGRIVEWDTSGDKAALTQILSTDEGSRFTGEFAIGLNPFVNQPIDDILYDEKMHGSIHFALGNAYDYADNGNRSSIHWDIIRCLRPEYGGGSIYLDGALIQQDGKFLPSQLENLNPENLTKRL